MERLEEDPGNLGFYMMHHTKTGRVFIAKILEGGWVEEEGDLEVGDELEFLNEKPVKHMKIEQICKIMSQTAWEAGICIYKINNILKFKIKLLILY